jgi:hypothetical protein
VEVYVREMVLRGFSHGRVTTFRISQEITRGYLAFVRQRSRAKVKTNVRFRAI